MLAHRINGGVRNRGFDLFIIFLRKTLISPMKSRYGGDFLGIFCKVKQPTERFGRQIISRCKSFLFLFIFLSFSLLLCLLSSSFYLYQPFHLSLFRYFQSFNLKHWKLFAIHHQYYQSLIFHL